MKSTAGHFGRNEHTAVDMVSMLSHAFMLLLSFISVSITPGTTAAVMLPTQAGGASPGLTVAVWVGEPELAGQEGPGSVAGASQR